MINIFISRKSVMATIFPHFWRMVHIVCHVEPNLRQKIERGEFVELEKLLPKDPMKRLMDKSRTWNW